MLLVVAHRRNIEIVIAYEKSKQIAASTCNIFYAYTKQVIYVCIYVHNINSCISDSRGTEMFVTTRTRTNLQTNEWQLPTQTHVLRCLPTRQYTPSYIYIIASTLRPRRHTSNARTGTAKHFVQHYAPSHFCARHAIDIAVVVDLYRNVHKYAAHKTGVYTHQRAFSVRGNLIKNARHATSRTYYTTVYLIGLYMCLKPTAPNIHPPHPLFCRFDETEKPRRFTLAIAAGISVVHSRHWQI